MRTHTVTLVTGSAALALLLAEAAAKTWAPPAPLCWSSSGFVLVALLLAVRSRRDLMHGSRVGVGSLYLWFLVLAVALALPLAVRVPAPEAWRAAEEARLRARFERVRTRVRELEAMVREAGDRAYALGNDSSLVSPAAAEARVRLFSRLEEVVDDVQRTARGTPPAPLGVQLFDSHGELLAWAGSVHAREPGAPAARAASVAQEVSFPQRGVFTFLVYERRYGADDPLAGAPLAPRVLVELPVDEQYRLGGRSLSGWSLDEELSGGGLEVTLLYDARFVPPYLTDNDLEILGDPQRGLQAEFVVRGEDGTLRVLGRLTGAPYGDRLATSSSRRRDAQGWLAVVCLATGGWLLLGQVRRRWPELHRRLWEPPLAGILGLWVVRGVLVLLDLPRGALDGPDVLSPAAFALRGFAGLLRSPLAFLLTMLALVGTAVLLFLHAVRRAAHTPGAGERPAAWRPGVGAFLAAGSVYVVVALALHLVARIAANTGPPLVGPELALTSPAVLCIHAALLGSVAALFILALLGVSSLVARQRSRWTLGLAAAVLVAALVPSSPIVALVGFALLVCGARLHFLLVEERFTSLGLAIFGLVALAATLNYEAIHQLDFHARQDLVRERAARVTQRVDALRPFVLERVLADLQADVQLQRRLTASRDAEPSGLAFEIWAGSMLCQLPWSCQVRTYDERGALTSEFAVGMPYASDTPTRDLQERARIEGTCVVLTEVETRPAGRVRLYRGASPLRSASPGWTQGTVVVDLPFAHEGLAFAANPPASTTELLLQLQDKRPPFEDPQRYLLAWLRDDEVVESSTPSLEVGRKLPAPGGGNATGWQRLRLADGTYRLTRLPVGERVLLGGFRLPTPVDGLLEWTQVTAFHFGVLFVVLILWVGLARLRALSTRLPALFTPKRIGFQQKLMGAFLVVALIPSVVLSLATRDIMRERSLTRNRAAALEKARSAEAALAHVVRREIQQVRESEYLQEILKQETLPPVRGLGGALEFSQIMVFHGDGRVIVDETLSSLSDADGRRFVSDAPRQIFASRDDVGNLHLGLLEEVWFPTEESLGESTPGSRLYWLYYRRRLTDGLLRDLASILNTDISSFLGPRLVVSSQKSLAKAGLLPTLAPPLAFTHVQLHRNPYAVLEQHSGLQRYFAGYLPLEDRFGTRLGTLAVSQLLRPDEVAEEVERTRALVVGLSTFMFVLTLLLGVVFAARIFDPVRNLIEGTRRIAGGQLGFRLRARSGDEIGELERSFNDMAAHLQAARAALEERRRYLEAVLGHIASGVVATDERGRITAANAAALRILRLPGSGWEGRDWRQLAGTSGDAGARSFWAHVGEAPEGEFFEVTMLQGDERLTVRLVVTDLRPAGAARAASLGRVAIFEDVTELIRSQKLAAWAEMARQVAHEIKNPLTPLKASAQFVEQAYRDGSGDFPRIFAEGMRTIVQQVDVLRHIASDFSDFGRVQKLEPKPVHLGPVLRRVTAPYLHMPGLELELAEPAGPGVGEAGAAAAGRRGEAASPYAGLRVLGDEEGLRKVFTNIFENAREAMDGKGKIRVSVEAQDGGQVQVLVTDEGCGLSAEATRRLFEPYFSTKSTGTGLGLAICRSILQELGGSIALSNRPEGGVEVRIQLVSC